MARSGPAEPETEKRVWVRWVGSNRVWGWCVGGTRWRLDSTRHVRANRMQPKCRRLLHKTLHRRVVRAATTWHRRTSRRLAPCNRRAPARQGVSTLSGLERIQAALDTSGAMAVGEIARASHLDRKTVQYHVHKMERLGVARRLRWGRHVLVHLSGEPAPAAVARRLRGTTGGRRLLRQLVEGPTSRAELARRAEVPWKQVARTLCALEGLDLAEPVAPAGRAYAATRRLRMLLKQLESG